MCFSVVAKGQETLGGVPVLTITDSRDGNKYAYRTYSRDIGFGVVIRQTWLLENMRYETKRGSVFHSGIYSESERIRYGRLYSKAATAEACPSGWHLPSDIEWQRLIHITNPGGLTFDSGDELVFRALKEDGDSGFNLQFGGSGGAKGLFNPIGQYGSYWSEYGNRLGGLYFDNTTQKIVRYLSVDDSDMYSCRCIKD